MVPLRASTTKSESLPDDPTAFVPSRPWNLPSITTWDDSRNQNHPTDSAEESFFNCWYFITRISDLTILRLSYLRGHGTCPLSQLGTTPGTRITPQILLRKRSSIAGISSRGYPI